MSAAFEDAGRMEKASKVYCPICAGDGCQGCDGEGRVWPEKFDAILERYDEIRWCECGRLALHRRPGGGWECRRCETDNLTGAA